MNAVNLEKMYEVLKFVEYGGYCRRSMDCVHGMLLIDRMKNEAVAPAAAAGTAPLGRGVALV